jgi:hypothetical protein
MVRIIIFLVLFFYGQGFWASEHKLPATLTQKIWASIYENNFEEAKKTILDSYGKYKNNLDILSFYEIVLNGLDERADANKMRRKILKIWNKKHRKHYEKENYPLNLSNYIRIAFTTDKYLFIGSEYYLPYPINFAKEGHYYHKITVFDKQTKKPVHLYKLEKSKYTNDDYILYKIESSGTSSVVHNYGKTDPALSEEMDKVKSLLVNN